MQFPTVKEYDFDRQFLFDEYVHGHFLSLRFKKSITEKLNNGCFSLCKIDLFSHVYDARQPVEFP
jgi:hypothetical protein